MTILILYFVEWNYIISHIYILHHIVTVTWKIELNTGGVQVTSWCFICIVTGEYHRLQEGHTICTFFQLHSYFLLQHQALHLQAWNVKIFKRCFQVQQSTTKPVMLHSTDLKLSVIIAKWGKTVLTVETVIWCAGLLLQHLC